MAEAREPFDELREAWRSLEAPASDAELDAPDARTEAAVDWMRGAWGALEAPAPRVAATNARHLLGGGPHRLGWLAAAAALLIVSVPLARRAFEPRTPAGEPAAPASAPAARLAALERPDGAIELREGPVRLVLVLPDPSPADRDGRSNR